MKHKKNKKKKEKINKNMQELMNKKFILICFL